MAISTTRTPITIKATVTDADGATGSYTQVVTMTAAPVVPPVEPPVVPPVIPPVVPPVTPPAQTKWADASNTGVPKGLALKASGGLNLTTAGQVVEGLNISGDVTIRAANITVKNCKITSGAYFIVNVIAGTKGAVVQNCEIDGTGRTSGNVGINGIGTFVANNIYGVENGINLTGSATLKDNYIHAMKAAGAAHYDGIQIDGGVSDIIIDHNTVINDFGQTSALMIDNYWGAINNIKVTNNLLVGGGYTVYVDAQFNKNPINGVSITGNHMGTGGYGITNFNQSSPVYTGNVNDGKALAAQLTK